MEKGKKLSQGTKLLALGVACLIVLIIIIISSFTFLINNVVPAVTPDDEVTNGQEIHFNIEGFEKLNL